MTTTTKPVSRRKKASPPTPGAPASTAQTGNVLELSPAEYAEDRDSLMARVAARGIVGNASSMTAFGTSTFGKLSLTDLSRALKGTAQELNEGDLSSAVTLLSAQASALNAIFVELAHRAAANMGQYLDATERYLRLALKAQGQCRATLETLAAIKNPPVVFARQANISHGGAQQVNNGVGGGPVESTAAAPAHAGQAASGQNELIEDSTHGRTLLDPTAAPAAGRAHPHPAPVGALDRTTHG